MRTTRRIEELLGDIDSDVAGIRLGAARAIAQAYEFGKREVIRGGFIDAHAQTHADGWMDPHPQGNRPAHVRGRNGKIREIPRVYNASKLMLRHGDLSSRFAAQQWRESGIISRAAQLISSSQIGKSSEREIAMASGGHADSSGSVVVRPGGQIAGVFSISGVAGRIILSLHYGRKSAAAASVDLSGAQERETRSGQRKVVANGLRRGMRQLAKYLQLHAHSRSR